MDSFQDAFISYGRADSKAFATQLYTRLLEKGLKIWFDQNDIPLGVDFQNQIDEGIEKAHNFLFIIAPHSINSPYCGKEIELALKRNKRIIPLLHVEQISRETWQQRFSNGTDEEWETYQAKGLHSSFPNMHPAIGKINWVYFREGIDDFEQSLTGLLELFGRHQNYVAEHTQLLAKALEWERQQKQSRYLLTGDERQQAEFWLKLRFKDEQPPCLPTDLHCEFITESIKNANNLMTDVFLSHAEENRVVMEKIRNSLRRDSITVWTNKTDIQTGEAFEEAINRGIEQADNLIFLLSPESLHSFYCQKELEYALSFNKRIIPILVRETPPEQVPSALKQLHYIDLTNNVKEEDYLLDESQLLNILRQDAVYYNEHKVLLAKALKWERQQRNPSVLLRGYNLRHAEAWLKVAQQRQQHLPMLLQEEFINESLRQPPVASVDVFVSYSRADSELARKLNDALQMQGKTTWFDQESIASGVDYQQEIYRGIESADNFLFIISPRSINSPYCADEVEYAAKLNKRFVTVLHREVNTKELHPELAKVQWIDFNRNEGDFWANFNQLVRTLDTDREHLAVHTRLMSRAMEWQREGQDHSFLLRGKDLETSEQWLKQAVSKNPKPTELHKKYITNSRKYPLRKPRRRTVLFGSLAASILVIGVRIFGGLQPWELAAYDHLLHQKPREEQDDRFLILEVTDEDISEILLQKYEGGKGTIPDPALNDILDQLEPYQPRIIGLDVYRDFKVRDDQEELATRLGNNNRLITLCKLSETDKLSGEEVSRGTKPPPEVPKAAVSERVGFNDFIQDENKHNRNLTLRRHLLVHQSDEYCPTTNAFSLIIARRYLEAEGKDFQPPLSPEGDWQPFKVGNTYFNSLRAFSGGYQGIFDADETYQMLLNYRSYEDEPSRFAPRVTLKEVLDNQLSEQDVKDKIVLIGVSSRQSANDYFFTPYGEISGVVLQGQMTSQIISAALDGRDLIWWWSFWGDFVWIAGWSLIGGIIVWRFQRPLYIALAGGTFLVILYGVCNFIFLSYSGWIPLIPAALVLLSSGIIVVGTTSKFSK
ncbi:MAG: TIR domain-containing protein [Coleofasciculaceae cyanobacterium]